MIDSARCLQLPCPKYDHCPISYATVAQISGIISTLPLSTPTSMSLSLEICDKLNFAATTRIAFTGFLRIGEFTFTRSDVDHPALLSAPKLTWADICLSPTFDYTQLHLKHSKAWRIFPFPLLVIQLSNLTMLTLRPHTVIVCTTSFLRSAAIRNLENPHLGYIWIPYLVEIAA
jgi:hypothetical protein